MDWARAGNWFFGVLCIVLLGGLAYYLSGESEETKRERLQDAETARVAAEQHKAKRQKQCAQVTEALDIAAARGRVDLAQIKDRVPACRRIEVEDCGYKVELLYELQLAGRTTLAQELGKIGDDCRRELEFATKHGLVAFRDHHKLLTEALDEARDAHEGRNDHDYRADDDYEARGRR